MTAASPPSHGEAQFAGMHLHPPVKARIVFFMQGCRPTMKRRKHKRDRPFKRKAPQPPPGPRTIEMEPEALAVYVRRAEQEVLPIIKELGLSPGTAQFLLAQCTQVLATGENVLTPESAMAVSDAVLTLWEAGYYTPGPDYPFTLEETLQEIEEGLKAKGDYADAFQPFTPMEEVPPSGMGQVAGGIVKHPETNLWQIWMIVNGPCVYFGAYQDPVAAHRGLEALVHVSRRGGTLTEGLGLSQKLLTEGDGEPKDLPFDMIVYLIDHRHRYDIQL